MKFLLLPMLLVAAPVLAIPPMPASTPEPPPERITALVVYGEDNCPRSSDDEIIVCARQPESERYRIPKALRNKKKDEPVESWAARTRTLDMVSKQGIPNSCSVNGSNGQTGCFHQFLEDARAQREADKAAAAQVP
jgi:hypothetical protein